MVHVVSHPSPPTSIRIGESLLEGNPAGVDGALPMTPLAAKPTQGSPIILHVLPAYAIALLLVATSHLSAGTISACLDAQLSHRFLH